MSAAILGALKFLPASLARKALSKVNPGFDTFFSRALSYGIDADRAIEYLSDRFQSDAQKSHQNQLDRGAANQTLRPDEAVSRSEMSNAAIPGKILKGAASLAIGGGLGMGGQKKTKEKKSPVPTQSEMKRVDALDKINKKVKPEKERSLLSPEGLSEQFEQQQSSQGKQQLLQSMKEITEYLQRLRGQ